MGDQNHESNVALPPSRGSSKSGAESFHDFSSFYAISREECEAAQGKREAVATAEKLHLMAEASEQNIRLILDK